MANTSLVIAADSVGATLSSARFTAPFGGRTNDSTESFSQVSVQSVGTYHDLFMRESGTGNGVLTLRKNSGNGNQTVTGAGAGTYHDSTHTDTVTAGQKLNFGGTAASLTPSLIAMLFDSTTNFAIRGATILSGGAAYTTGTDFTCINGTLAVNASNDAGVKTHNQKACTMVNGMGSVSANNKTQVVTLTSRKNGVNANIAVSVTASTTGIFEDTTHSDSLAANDDWNMEFINGTDTTHTQTWRAAAVDYTTSTGGFFIVQAGADADVVGTASSTQFIPIGGQFAFTATESFVQSNALTAFTYSNANALRTQATSTNTATYNFRKNTGNGNMTMTIGTANGNYTDSTHTDSVISTDAVNGAITFGSGTVGGISQLSVYGNSFPGYNQTVYVEWEES